MSEDIERPQEFQDADPKVGQIWHDVDRHDGRWWPYKIIRDNKKTYTVVPCHPHTLAPVSLDWKYRIPKEQFDDHQTRHRVVVAAVVDADELKAARRDPRVRAFLDEADEYLASFERRGRNL